MPLKLFSEDDAKASALPALRIVLSLAPEVFAHPATYSSYSPQRARDIFTAYDLWIAGAPSESLGVTPDENTHDQVQVFAHSHAQRLQRL